MIGKKSFILHLDSLDVLDYLDKDQIADLFTAIRDYHVKGIEAVPASLRAVFVPFKNQFDRDLKSYEKKCEANRHNGQKGGRPKKEINPKNPDGFFKSEENQNEPKKPDNDNDKDNDSENDNNILLKKETKDEILSEAEFSEEVEPEKEERKKVAPKKERYFNKNDFKKKLLDLGVDEKHANDWIQVRKDKRASFTESAIDGIIRECEKYNFPFPEAIKNCAESSWQGFKYEWIKNKENGNTKTNAGSSASESKSRFSKFTIDDFVIPTENY